MSANAFDTLKAAKSLKAAGFDEAQAEAVVATVGDAVREHTAPLASSIATIGDTMATKEDVATVKEDVETVKKDVEIVKKDVATVAERVSAIADTMATKEYVAATIAVEFKTLYRHLWVMGTSIIGVTVALNKLLP